MFGMIYRKKILLSLRNPSLMIWTLLFPLGLATLFYLAFGNLDQERQFHVIPVALVSEGLSILKLFGIYENGYIFAIALITAVIDIVPVLGTGTVLICLLYTSDVYKRQGFASRRFQGKIHN